MTEKLIQPTKRRNNDSPHSASVIICWNNKILLFHRDNIPTISDPDCWGLPGGHIKRGETQLQGMMRELQEEVSYIPKGISLVGKIKGNGNNSYVYCAFVDEKEAKLFKHGVGEGQEIGFFTIEEAFNIKLSPTVAFYLNKFRNEMDEAMENKEVPKITL